MGIAKKIMLHTCCAPCASACLEQLKNEGEEPLLFFSNSNIDSVAEYYTRLLEVRGLAGCFEVALLEDPYDHKSWLEAVSGLEQEPEKGGRCLACFRFSLSRTAEKAVGYNFATTLTISPHKRTSDLFRIGSEFKGFLPLDFKKKTVLQEACSCRRS